MAVKVPVFKKKVNAFLTSEEGKISKQAMLVAGGILAGVAAASIASKSVNASTDVCSNDLVKGCCDPGVGTNTNTLQCYGHKNGLGTQFATEGNNGVLSTTHNHHYNHGSHASHASHGSHGAGCCFPAGTMVSTEKGKKDIKDIREGEVVITYNLNNKKIEETTVLKVISPTREGIFEINNDLINVTNDHPFYTKKKDGGIGWAAIDKEFALKNAYKNMTDLKSLDVGDFIFTKEGKWAEIKSIKYIKGKVRVYTLSVSKNESFFANDLLVHNMGGCGGWC